MDWKDTVITNKEIVAQHKNLFPWMYQGNDDDWCEEQLHRLISLSETNDGQFLLEAQAEISFKAGEEKGKQERIKEVVDDIENNFMIKNSANPDFLRNGIIIASPEQWQAQLKEWGIKEEK